ncbi:hypothetical protein Tco_0068038 [Tanacetum coccineum]
MSWLLLMLLIWIKELPILKVTEICVVSPKTKLEKKTLVTLVASPKELQAERKETGVSYTLVVKGVKDVMENAILEVIKLVTDDTPDALLPLRNTQHQIDLSRKTTLLVSISVGYSLLRDDIIELP